MKTQNKVQLIGYLAQDPEIKTFDSGAQLVRLRIATDRYSSKEGKEKLKITTWHTVVAWDSLGDQVMNTMLKGSHVQVEGEIRYRDYLSKEGIQVRTAEIHANQFIDLDR